jgi:hypothetical protein
VLTLRKVPTTYLHSPSLACRVFLIKKPYSSKSPFESPFEKSKLVPSKSPFEKSLRKFPSVAARTLHAATARATARAASGVAGWRTRPPPPSALARPLRGAESHVEPPGRHHPNNAFTYNI